MSAYKSVRTFSPNQFDNKWLEATNLSKESPIYIQLVEFVRKNKPNAIRDLDGDSYVEIETQALLAALLGLRLKDVNNIPFTSFFADKKGVGSKSRRRAIAKLPIELRKAAAKHDFNSAQQYFKNNFNTNVLSPKLARILAAYLNATAMHGGIDAPTFPSPAGFSVHSSGRLRFDCETYAGLAQFVTKFIPNFSRTHVIMAKTEASLGKSPQGTNIPLITHGPKISFHLTNPQPKAQRPPIQLNFEQPNEKGLQDDFTGVPHMILLLSDEHGNHLIIDNDSVTFLQGIDMPRDWIRSHYAQLGYKYFDYKPISN